jgi:DNA-damage-inducible protein J
MEKALPFDEEAPNVTTVAAMQEARTGKLPSFRDVPDLMGNLNADD